jgi:hypothetical protein
MIKNIIEKIVGFFKKIFNKKQEEVKLTAQATTFTYLINDPTYSSTLKRTISPPAAETGLKITVRNFVTNPSNDTQVLSAQVYTALQNHKVFFQNIIAQFRSKFSRWPASTNLNVVPDAGVDFNAYYDRSSLKFFHASDVTVSPNNVVYSGQSNDIACHELGHGILDCLRPDLWNSVAPEVWAFHESFGDISALLAALTYDENITAALNATGNDLSQSNVITRLAEELGIAIYNMYDGADNGNLNYALRDASVHFDYVPITSLPTDGPDNILINEPHSFSRVFTSAFWDMFVAIYNKNRTNGQMPLVAAKNSRDTCAAYLVKACILAPLNSKFFASMANAFIAADRAKGSPYANQVKNAFVNRGIIRASVKMQSEPIHRSEITLKLGDEALRYKDGLFVRVSKVKLIKLSDHIGGNLNILSDLGDLANVDLEIPNDTYYEFNENGYSVYEMKNNEQENIKHALKAVQFIQNKNQLGEGKNWLVENNKLQRNNICRMYCKH